MRIADMPDYAKEIPPNSSPNERKRWNYQRFIKDYLRCIAAVNESVRVLLDCLQHLGVLDDTLITYTSDNGFFLGEHGWYDKRFMDEPSIRIPLLMHYPPKVSVGKVDKNIVLNLNFAPTILDFAGVAIPAEIQGRSLQPLLQGKAPKDWRKELYQPMVPVYTRVWKSVKLFSHKRRSTSMPEFMPTEDFIIELLLQDRR